MYIPLTIKTDYSLLKSMIKVNSLLSISSNALGIVDDNLSYVMEFYNFCNTNNKKMIIGLDIILNDKHLYLYAKNYAGYLELLYFNNNKDLKTSDFKDKKNIIMVVPYESIELFDELDKLELVYLGYSSETEKKNVLLKTDRVVFINLTLCLKSSDTKYLSYLYCIETGLKINEVEKEYQNNYLIENLNPFDIETTIKFSELIDIDMDFNNRYIPHIEDNEKKLESLIKKGINKRLNNKVPLEYATRIKYEFSVIKEMGFIDYFLIVYDYVLYAKKHNILVGPGRGSAAASLIAYSLGITDIDPIKYNLIFERFLNKERVTMPDIDLDFEDTKREEVIKYIKEKYGNDYVALIMTYGTLGSRQVIRDIARALSLDTRLVDSFSSLINPHQNLKDNLVNYNLKYRLDNDPDLFTLYKIALKLEGLKRHISTHAAGIVISSEPLNHLIPVVQSGEYALTGFTMEYLEHLGLIKMDILSLENLSAITNVKELVKNSIHENIDLSTISLNDEKTLRLFYDVDTIGIFQFESKGMMNFLRKLRVQSFNDLINAVALFRPGPMDNIDSFIKRREGKEKIDYLDPSLEPILKDTYGIIVYQEQVMEILNKMGGYTYAEADNVRRAMSKKKKDIILKEKEHFISNSIKNGYQKETSEKVYNYILKFANYGFNKAHSVSYAMIGYWMGYLKSNYRVSFICSLLNINIGSEIKAKSYINEAKRRDVLVIKPSINNSDLKYKIVNYNILMPLAAIKNVGSAVCEAIISEREKGLFKDFLDFVARCYGKSINKKVIESLIDAGCFDEFNVNHHTLQCSIDTSLNYAELMHDLDESLVGKPILDEYPEYDINELMKREINALGLFLTNHPASKYVEGYVKAKEFPLYFDKFIKSVILIDHISNIKTKKNDDMGFIDGSDETGLVSTVVFPKNSALLEQVKKGDLVLVTGKVAKRFDEYQIVVSNLEKIN